MQPSLAERIAGLSKLRMAELKAELQQFDLDTSGSKADLIERLSARLKADADAEAQAETKAVADEHVEVAHESDSAAAESDSKDAKKQQELRRPLLDCVTCVCPSCAAIEVAPLGD